MIETSVRTSLHLGVIALLVASIRQLVAIGMPDGDAPIVAIQKGLESLRVERIRATKPTLLCSPLLWAPLLIVALKGLFDIDADVFPLHRNGTAILVPGETHDAIGGRNWSAWKSVTISHRR